MTASNPMGMGSTGGLDDWGGERPSPFLQQQHQQPPDRPRAPRARRVAAAAVRAGEEESAQLLELWAKDYAKQQVRTKRLVTEPQVPEWSTDSFPQPFNRHSITMESGSPTSPLRSREVPTHLASLVDGAAPLPPAPVGERRARRASYSIGYGALGPAPANNRPLTGALQLAGRSPLLSYEPDSLLSPAAGGTVLNNTRRLPPATSVGLDSFANLGYDESSTPGGSSRLPTASNAGEGGDSQSGGLLKRMGKRMIKKVKSRAQLVIRGPTESEKDWQRETTAANSGAIFVAPDFDKAPEQHIQAAQYLDSYVVPDKITAGRISAAPEIWNLFQADMQHAPIEFVDDQYANSLSAAGAHSSVSGIQPSTATDLRHLVHVHSIRRGLRKESKAILLSLVPFVPKTLIAEVVQDDTKYAAFDNSHLEDLMVANHSLRPSMVEVQGAVMIADVKGFTALTEILSKKGTGGVELLTTCMNSYFTQVINVILAYDGDVIKFAGDSMIVLFRPRLTQSSYLDEERGLREAARRCACCAHVLAENLGHMRMKMNGQAEPIGKPGQEGAEGEEAPEAAAAAPGSELMKRTGTLARKRGTTPGPSPSPAAIDERNMTAVQHAAQHVATARLQSNTNLSNNGSMSESGTGGQPSRQTSVPGLVIVPDTPVLPSGMTLHMNPLDSCGIDGDDSRLSNEFATPTSLGPGTPASHRGNSFSKKPKKNSSWFNVTKRVGQGSKKLQMEDSGSVISANNTGIASSRPSLLVEGRTGSSSPHASAGFMNLRKKGKARNADGPAQNRVSSMLEDGLLGGPMAPREMSFASKLNIPPPVRNMPNANSNTALSALAAAYQPMQRAPAGSNAYQPDRVENLEEKIKNSEFSLKIMVGAGSIAIFRVGGEVDELSKELPEVPRWEYFIADRPLAPLCDDKGRRRPIAQVAAIEDQAEAGQVVASHEVVKLLQDDWDILPLKDDVSRILNPKQPFTELKHPAPLLRTRRVGSTVIAAQANTSTSPNTWQESPDVMEPIKLASITSVALPEQLYDNATPDLSPECVNVAQELSALEDHVQQRLLNVNRMLLLGSVRPHIEEAYLDSVSENRQLTCLFIGFPTLLAETSSMSPSDQLSAVQFCMQQLQRIMAQYNGSLLQFRCDEKGYVAICAFGLPGHTHEDNPGRGIVAALELQKVINDARHRVVIGVTTGELLCTCVGARKLRLEYTVFGDAINLSARLMVKCKKGSTNILCDEPTFQSLSARYRAHYNQLEPLAVKGKEKRVQVYEVIPRGAGDALESNNAPLAMSERIIVGRENELNYIINRAVPLMTNMPNADSTTHGGTILLEGITGMGKTMLLNEARKWLDMIEKQYEQRAAQTGVLFNILYGIADVSNKNSKLFAWRRVFQEMFAVDRSRSREADAARGTGTGRGSSSSAGTPAITSLGNKLASHFPQYNEEWRKQIADWLELPIIQIPKGGECTDLAATSSMDTATMPAPGFAGVRGSGTGGPNALGVPPPVAASGRMASMQRSSNGADAHVSSSGNAAILLGRGRAGARSSKPAANSSLSQAAVMLAASNSALRSSPGPSLYTPPTSNAQYLTALIPQESKHQLFETAVDASTPTHGISTRMSTDMSAAAFGDSAGMQYSMKGAFGTLAQTNSSHYRTAGTNGTNSAAGTPRSAGRGANNTARAPTQAANRSLDSTQVLFEVFRVFIRCYGNVVILLENLHEFDTPSWKLLNKIVDKLRSHILLVATSRPSNDSSESAVGGSRPGAGRVHAMYRQLLNMPSTKLLTLGPFNFQQTKTLMTQVGNKSFPDQFVLAVMEKTGGMPHYIEKITEFLSQKQWVDDEGNEIMNVNKAIRTLNFKQVILHRLDKLPVSVHLTLKVASIMGQWVDLDILHKFYPPRVPITKEQLEYNLTELEQSKFLKSTDTYGVWEFNMVERDSVYEVLPTKTKRMLHARLAAELERSSEEGEQHVATLTTIAYHWNQACLEYETTKQYRALKAIEYWAKAAEAGYSVSSLSEALRLYQKAADIARLLHNAVGSQHHDDFSEHDGSVQSDNSSESFIYQADDSYDLPSDGTEPRIESRGHTLFTSNDVPPPRTGDDDESDDDEFDSTGKRRHLKWSLISNRSRAQWEKWMASCCLGIIMQQQVDPNAQVELHDSADYLQLLISHAMQGLQMMGTPDLHSLMASHAKPEGVMALFSCCMPRPEPLMGWKLGLVLQEQDINEIKDLLLVLIIAADNCKVQLDSSSCIHILRVCKRICLYFRKCCATEQDPLVEVEQICKTRIRAHRSRKKVTSREQHEEEPDFAYDS